MNIHPTAVIDEGAKLGENVKVGPYAVIENDVVIGDGTLIETHAHVCSGARIGKNCRICSFSTVSGDPQDLHYDTNITSYTEIGDNTTIREGASIHRATFDGKATVVGKNCLIMANVHLGHDVVLGDNIIIGCFTAVAGHAHISTNAIISGGVMVHQFCRVGEGAIISGNSAISMDVPPFVNAFARNNIAGLNLIGMMRRKMTREEVSDVKHLYMHVYSSATVKKNAMAAIEGNLAKTDAGRRFLDFFTRDDRHYLQPRKGIAKS